MDNKCSLTHYKDPNKQFDLNTLLILICIGLVIFILLFVFGICIEQYCEKKQNAQSLLKFQDEQSALNEEKQKEEEEKKRQEELKFKNSKLPVLTQEGMDKMENIYFSDTKRVFLTFDDGPSTNTEPILEILKQNNINATFFVLGSNVDRSPQLVKRAWEEGNYIASHGYTHNYKEMYSSIDNVLSENDRALQAIRNAIECEQYTPHLFRFPGGKAGGPYSEIKAEAAEVLKSKGIYNIDWSALSGDAEGNNLSVEKLMARTIETVGQKKNIVLLMHDSQAKTTTVDALPQIIQYFKDNGYEFCTFYDIFNTQEDLIENPDLIEIKEYKGE